MIHITHASERLNSSWLAAGGVPRSPLATHVHHTNVMAKLLIIDDDESVRKLLRIQLKDTYEILDSSSPEEALSMALQHRPDAILLDLMMPRYSGFEVCQTLSSLSFTQHIPILIVSGESSERYREFCENIGAKGFFEKPVDFEALQRRLAGLIDKSHHDPRAEPRVRLRVMLTLQGKDSTNTEFSVVTATENVGSNAFLCGCQAPLGPGAIVRRLPRQEMINRSREMRA